MMDFLNTRLDFLKYQSKNIFELGQTDIAVTIFKVSGDWPGPPVFREALHSASTVMSIPSAATIVPDTGIGPLAPGERIVFFGDSITQAGDDPGGYVDLVRRAIEAAVPGHGIGVFGAGVSGNKVRDLEERLHQDVLATHPTRVVVYIGINDVWHSLSGEGTPKDAFESGLRGLVDGIRQRESRVILCTPSVIGERPALTNPLDAMLETYSDVTRSVAADMQAGLVDLRQAFTAHLAAVNAVDRADGMLTTDGVHLNAAGNRFVADRMLEAFAVTARSGRGRPTDFNHP